MPRTVRLDPIVMIVAILVGVEWAGILGALTRGPFAGIIHVIVRDIWDHRRGLIDTTVAEPEVPFIGTIVFGAVRSASVKRRTA